MPALYKQNIFQIFALRLTIHGQDVLLWGKHLKLNFRNATGSEHEYKVLNCLSFLVYMCVPGTQILAQLKNILRNGVPQTGVLMSD